MAHQNISSILKRANNPWTRALLSFLITVPLSIYLFIRSQKNTPLPSEFNPWIKSHQVAITVINRLVSSFLAWLQSTVAKDLAQSIALYRFHKGPLSLDSFSGWGAIAQGKSAGFSSSKKQLACSLLFLGKNHSDLKFREKVKVKDH